MRVLFVHQNMPGQFGQLAARLATETRNKVVFITRRKECELPGVLRVSYELKLPKFIKRRYGDELKCQALHGEAVVRACQALSQRGYKPDVIIGHPGWGELLFIRDIYPDIPLIDYCEFYYDPTAPYFEGDPPAPLSLDRRMRRRAQSAHLLLSLEAADQGWSPTNWQKSLHPAALRSKIEVIFDGVDTDRIRPDIAARFSLPDGRSFGVEDEVITYAARSLEPSRGFPNFIRALPAILARRPSAHIVIAGGQAPHYDPPPSNGKNWYSQMLEEVALDHARVHFVGMLPRAELLSLQQVSKVHVYLTSPIVLSWSFVEAMSAGCMLVASDTAPVREFLTNEVNGLLTDFHSPEQIAIDVELALQHRDRKQLRSNARTFATKNLDLNLCQTKQIKSILDLIV